MRVARTKRLRWDSCNDGNNAEMQRLASLEKQMQRVFSVRVMTHPNVAGFARHVQEQYTAEGENMEAVNTAKPAGLYNWSECRRVNDEAGALTWCSRCCCCY